MNLSRKLGILIVAGIPAIIGGGMVYAVSGSYAYVIVYEIILLLVAALFTAKA